MSGRARTVSGWLVHQPFCTMSMMGKYHGMSQYSWPGLKRHVCSAVSKQRSHKAKAATEQCNHTAKSAKEQRNHKAKAAKGQLNFKRDRL